MATTTTGLKGLNDLTENEYEHLYELGETVILLREHVEKQRDLRYLPALRQAEQVLEEVCDEFGADLGEIRRELA